jgi:hypothetical protein
MIFARSTAAALLMMLAAFGALSLPARALDPPELEALLSEANTAFQEGNRVAATDTQAAQAHYEDATLRLERIIREGGIQNGKLFYNLGNIWYQRGDIGRSVLNYLRAEQYIPNNVNLQQNLAFVRQQRRDRFEETDRRKVLSTLFFWHYDLASGTRLRLFAISFLLFWGLAAARLFWRKPAITLGLALSGAVALALFVSLSLEARHHQAHPRGVVIAPEVVARKGDGETYQPSFAEPLHAGTEFTVHEDRGAWLLVALPDERTCWVPRGDIALVRDLPGAESASVGSVPAGGVPVGG